MDSQRRDHNKNVEDLDLRKEDEEVLEESRNVPALVMAVVAVVLLCLAAFCFISWQERVKDLTAVQTGIEELEQSLDGLGQSVSALQEVLAEGKVATLMEEIDRLELTNSRLVQQVAQMKAEVEAGAVYTSPAAEGYFDDALFVGDSVSYRLELYVESQRSQGIE